MNDITPAVQANNLIKHFPSRTGTVEAVRGVDLTVRAGEVFGFLGPNGAGKSTTVRMLTTLLSITSGTASVAGLDVAGEPDGVRRRIGVALQEAGLDPRQTGRELLVLQARLFGLSPQDASRRAQELLALVELEDAADRLIKGYSGGMERRLDLASALVHEPDVLFLDEPTTGLDPASRLTVWDEVRRINARGTTVFLTTQYLEEADVLCDRLAIIDHGKIVAEGTSDQLKQKVAGDVVTIGVDGSGDSVLTLVQAMPFVREASHDAEAGLVRLYVDRGETAVPHLLRSLDAAGYAPTSISLNRPSLDDVFLRQTGRSLREEAA